MTIEDERKEKEEGVLEGCFLFLASFLFVFSRFFLVMILVQIWLCFLCFEDSISFKFLKFLNILY